MKILYVLLLSLILNANCTKEETEASNQLFFKASQEQSLDVQLGLLEKALEVCFSYEVEVSLLLLKVDKSTNKEEKEALYDQLLESLSNIENNDVMVKAEQKKINKALAKLHQEKNPELSIIYEQKSDVEEVTEVKTLKEYTWWILFAILLVGYGFSGFFRGK